MRVIRLKNVQASSDVWHGQTIGAGEYFTISDERQRGYFAVDQKVNQDIWSDPAKLVVANETEDLTNPKEGVDWLNGSYAALNTTSSEGTLLIETSLRHGAANAESITIISPDFTDRTTWYQNSTQVTGETLSGGPTVYTAANEHWINTLDSKLTYDFKGLIKRDGTMSPASDWHPVIYDNGTPVTSGITIDYATGTVTFDSAPTGPVTADYYHNDGTSFMSDWLYLPPTGYRYEIEHVELQFSDNIDFTNGHIKFDIFAGADPATYQALAWDRSHPVCQEWTDYKKLRDLINWCNNSYPILPVKSNPEFTNDILVFPFKYLYSPQIDSTYGTCIRVSIDGDVPLNNEIATVTIYGEKVALS